MLCSCDIFRALINPFSAPACTFSGLKNAHIHAYKQDLFSSYNKSTLNTVHFDGKSTSEEEEEEERDLIISNTAHLLVVLK